MFSDRLKQLRKEKKLSQEEFANIIGVSRYTITKYETGEREPDIKTIIKIADYFNVSIDYLFCRSNTKKIDTYLVINSFKKIYKSKVADEIIDLICTILEMPNYNKIESIRNILKEIVKL